MGQVNTVGCRTSTRGEAWAPVHDRASLGHAGEGDMATKSQSSRRRPSTGPDATSAHHPSGTEAGVSPIGRRPARRPGLRSHRPAPQAEKERNVSQKSRQPPRVP